MSKFSRGNSKAAKLTNEQIYELRQKYAGGATQSALSLEYQIAIGTVGRIVRGESRQSVPMVISPEDIQASQDKLMRMLGQPPNGIAKLKEEVEKAPQVRAERNLRELENWDAASKFGVVKGDSQ